MKKIPYARQWVDNKDIEAVCRALRSSYLTQGFRVRDFEESVASYCGAKYAVAVNSGTAALHIACMAAGLKKGDEAITSPITFVASANAVLYCGTMPVFADISEDNAIIDVDEIKKKISVKTKAIIPVDFAGHPADLEKIKAIAEKKQLIVIEDAAHALGAKYNGHNIGSGQYVDMVTFSFHAVKNITTGEGGMILTNNKSLYNKLLKLRTHGITRDQAFLKRKSSLWYYEMQELGFNYRLTDVQCALGISQLKKLNRFIKKRKEITSEYNRAFAKYDELKPLKERNCVNSAYHLYILRFDRKKFLVSRGELFSEYRKKGILVNVHYIPVYLQPYYSKLGYKKKLCPQAEKYYQEAITLPLYPKMLAQEVKKVIEITQQIVAKFKK